MQGVCALSACAACQVRDSMLMTVSHLSVIVTHTHTHTHSKLQENDVRDSESAGSLPLNEHLWAAPSLKRNVHHTCSPRKEDCCSDPRR